MLSETSLGLWLRVEEKLNGQAAAYSIHACIINKVWRSETTQWLVCILLNWP